MPGDPSSPSPAPIWHKTTRAHDWVTRFTVGDDYRWDTLLLPYDIEGTRAHAWGLVQIGVLTEDELSRIGEALDAIRAEWEGGTLVVQPEDEDAHTVIEHQLTERLGDVGKKIHTGRSRNDQVLAALRLYLRDRIDACGRSVSALAQTLCDLGEAHAGALMPGYTHMQQAMPSTAGLWALGYAELLASDLDALRAARYQINVSPLGSAAGYGVPHLDLPREAVAQRLGFRAVQTHTTAVQLSRGKLELHILHALMQTGATLNRWAADLVLFNTSEYGFVELPDAYCTGSSIMPQKKNPDVLELLRAHYHRLTSEAHLLMTLPANLPSGYHRDLQLTKESVMRGMQLAEDMLDAACRVTEGLRFNTERMQAACAPGLLATGHALQQVRQGVPFREAYRSVGQGDYGATPDAQQILSAYITPGTPGHPRPDLIREQLTRHDEWARAE